MDNRGAWIGLQYEGTKGFQWTDDSEISYENWSEGEPNDYEGNAEDCGEMYGDGRWNDDVWF